MMPAIGRVGVFSAQLQRLGVGEAIDRVGEWESLGFEALWLPEGPAGRDSLTFASVLLAGSSTMTVVTAVAMIWARDPVAMINGARTILEAYPNRFVLGLGVSHQVTASARGHQYRSPIQTMRNYLDEMRTAPFIGPEPAPDVPILLGALGPKMVELAGEMTSGVHPFLSTPAHTRTAREILGNHKLIAVEQSVVIEPDPEVGMEVARRHLAGFVGRENYANHFRRMGFNEPDPHDDELVRSLYAVGDLAAVRGRIVEHMEAGADHVCLNVVGGPEREAQTLRLLAPLTRELI